MATLEISGQGIYFSRRMARRFFFRTLPVVKKKTNQLRNYESEGVCHHAMRLVRYSSSLSRIPFMEVLDWMRPPAPADGPAQASLLPY